MFHGSITALVTPFKNGEIDWKAFENLVEWQIEQGSHGVVPCGTTGESPCLDESEMKAIFERCVAVVKGRIPVIAGTGSNYTKKSIALTNMARDCKVDAALIVAPYYNKPTQDGLIAHYTTIHESTSLPIILYNVPGRTVIEIALDTIVKLSELPRIIGIKDATTDLTRATLLRQRIQKPFTLLSGEDGTAGGYLAQGGDGCISVTSNAAPALCAAVQNTWKSGDMKTFMNTQAALMPLHRALFLEPSPAPVKYALSKLGLCSDEVRLPLRPATESCQKQVDAALAHAGLLNKDQAKKAS